VTGIIVLICLSDNTVCGLIQKLLIMMYMESGAAVGLIIEKLAGYFSRKMTVG